MEAGEPAADEGGDERQRAVETSPEELQFFEVVRDICVKGGMKADEILYRDTVNYFNVSVRRPTKWFVRFFASAKRKFIVTWVPTEEAKALAPGFEVEGSPAAWGVSRVYIDGPAQLWAAKDLVLRSLELAQARKDEAADPSSSAS